MPAYEIHVETFTAEEIPVVEAKDAYEAAIQYAARWAPVTIRRVRPEQPGDAFVVHAIGSFDTDENGIHIEVFEHDPTAEPWA